MDVRNYFTQRLEEDPDHRGWWNWYVVQKNPRVLIGAGGFVGPPDESGTVTLGYSVLAEFEGKGYASELTGGLVKWAGADARVKRIFATTFEHHHASVRVLAKNGFTCEGVSSEDMTASDADRQGRGRLMLFVLPRRWIADARIIRCGRVFTAGVTCPSEGEEW